MKKNKRSISAFNLSFLDIMFCGFGAVVLLVLIINSKIVGDNKAKVQDLSSEVDKVEIEVTAAQLYQRNMLQSLQKSQTQSDIISNKNTTVLVSIAELQDKKQQENDKARILKKHINDLQSDLKQLNKKKQQQEKAIEIANFKNANKVRQYEGEGNRQYLTGLKLGGKRVLILLDSSASMLDDTIVNIIVKRNLSKNVKRKARKWQQAVNIVRWVAANLPQNSQVLIVSFNESLQSLANGQLLQWKKSTDVEHMNHQFNNLASMVPQHGTNLYKAFTKVRGMSPRPDNIILITDGLPTMGRDKSFKTKVSPSQRIKLFQQAIKRLPAGIPVNIILLPMEGDPMAASLFWQLAIDSQGSFLTPSQDWP